MLSTIKSTYFLTAEVHGYLRVTYPELVVGGSFKETILGDLCGAQRTQLPAGGVSLKPHINPHINAE